VAKKNEYTFRKKKKQTVPIPANAEKPNCVKGQTRSRKPRRKDSMATKRKREILTRPGDKNKKTSGEGFGKKGEC